MTDFADNLLTALYYVPVGVALVVGVVLVGIRRRRLGGAGTVALVGFAVHLLAYVLGGISEVIVTTADRPQSEVLYTLGVATTLLRIAGFVLLILAFVRIAGTGSGAVPYPPGSGTYPPGPAFVGYPPVAGIGPYPPAAWTPPPQAHRGQAPGDLLRGAVAELHEMGRSGPLQQNGQAIPRVREIGQLLHESGGIGIMKEAHAQFARALPHLGRDLDIAWNGIGGWQA